MSEKTLKKLGKTFQKRKKHDSPKKFSTTSAAGASRISDSCSIVSRALAAVEPHPGSKPMRCKDAASGVPSPAGVSGSCPPRNPAPRASSAASASTSRGALSPSMMRMPSISRSRKKLTRGDGGAVEPEKWRGLPASSSKEIPPAPLLSTEIDDLVEAVAESTFEVRCLFRCLNPFPMAFARETRGKPCENGAKLISTVPSSCSRIEIFTPRRIPSSSGTPRQTAPRRSGTRRRA